MERKKMDEEDFYWYCFDDFNLSGLGGNHLYCIWAPSKEEGAKKVERATGFKYDRGKHLVARWGNVDEVCSAYGLDSEAWNRTIDGLEEMRAIKGEFVQGKTTVVIINFMNLETEVERYGAYCGKCGQYFPHALFSDQFKCWGCRHGY